MAIGSYVPVGLATPHRQPRSSFRLNVPNPFNPATAIQFTISEPEHVRLNVYSLNGQLVRTLIDSLMYAGQHSVTWDASDSSGRDVASGVYLCRLMTDSEMQSSRLVLVR